MMTTAKGRPMPTAPPITIAIAKSKPAIACQDISHYSLGRKAVAAQGWPINRY
jgi:uncharacterized Fe-S cluster-containing radical SAM superfamily enzyme